MNTKIDIKSAVVGFGVGVLVMLSVAASSWSGPVGRYQIAGTGNHGLILDTMNGQVWSGYFAPTEGKTDADFFHAKIGEKR